MPHGNTVGALLALLLTGLLHLPVAFGSGLCFDAAQLSVDSVERDATRFALLEEQLRTILARSPEQRLTGALEGIGFAPDPGAATVVRAGAARLALVPLRGAAERSLFAAAYPAQVGRTLQRYLLLPFSSRRTPLLLEFAATAEARRITRLSVALPTGDLLSLYPGDGRREQRRIAPFTDDDPPPEAPPACTQCVIRECLWGEDWCTWAMTLMINCWDCWAHEVCSDCHTAIAQSLLCGLVECEACEELCADVLPQPHEGMVVVAPGSFTMGDGESQCGTDQRLVTLTHEIEFDQAEVTNGEYLTWLQWAYDQGYVTATAAAVTDNLGSDKELVDLDDADCEIAFDPGSGLFSLRQAPAALAHAYPGGYDPANHPVVEVSWYGAASFCDWLSLSEGYPPSYDHSTWLCGPAGDPYSATGFRLPTDAEWEYVAQFSDERLYPWGGAVPDCELANFMPADTCLGWSAPVASYALGDQPGFTAPISDLAGNTAEWVNDWYSCNLGTAPITDPVGPDGGWMHVLRGGSWRTSAAALRNAERHAYFSNTTLFDIGFRVVRSN
jgi:formylglycine-generating enzyme required for sulfatase activity